MTFFLTNKALSITRPKQEYEKLRELYLREKDAKVKQRMAVILTHWDGVLMKEVVASSGSAAS
ncbi:MAG: hypothetical protein QXO71_01875 [Candidatus Jordarchaeaceae archaeon]